MTDPAAAAKILVVDDTRVNRMVLEAQLTKHGFAVSTAEDGREALASLGLGTAPPDDPETDDPPPHSPAFDAVILDIMMPEIDGIEVLKEIRGRWSSIELPVVMATAKDRSEDIVEALHAGASDYVTKPVDIEILLARLGVHLALSHSHESLKAAQRSLIHAAKMETTGLLAAGVAHEIRNPLAQLQMAADGISDLESVQEDEMAQQLTGIMAEAVEKADSIVRRLMDCSGTAHLDLQAGDLNEVASRTLELLEEEFSNAGLTVAENLADPLGPALLAADDLQQALVNILVNAIQASPKGGTITVTTLSETARDLPTDEGARGGNRIRTGDQIATLRIEDEGPGIAEPDLDSLFDAFFTTKPTGTGAGAGAGLGLTVAKKIMDLHGGIITVENRAGQQGARVTLSLPTPQSLRTAV